MPEIAGPDSLDETIGRLRRLGYSEPDAGTLADHFLDAERRGKSGHGLVRVDWLESLANLEVAARAVRVAREAAYERWE